MTKKQIKFVQTKLNARGINAGPADGLIGNKTLDALNQVEAIPQSWSNKRKVVAFIQLLAKEKNIETGVIDGYWGPQTEFAFETLVELEQDQSATIWRPEELSIRNPNDWPSQSDEKELIKYYGQVGENQTRVQLPYTHKLAWNTKTKINSFQCHEKVHDSIHSVLTRVLDHYGLEQIKKLRLDYWGGCLNVRTMRGGSKPSLHSWGIAIDYDPSRNKLKWGRDRAAFAKPEYDMWWRFWEEEGWVSLGRTRNFDWMHVQAAKVC